MIDPGTGTLRIMRGSVLAVVCTLLALAGHAGGGGDLPPLTPLLVTGGLVGATFVILADRRRGLASIGAAAVASQFIFHGAFALVGHGGVWPDARMASAHVLSAAVLTVLASHGEALVWTVARLSGIVGRFSLLVLPPPAPVRLIASGSRHLPEPRTRLDARVHPRRGPPACWSS